MLSRTRGAWLLTLAANGVILASNVASGILVARLLLPEGRGVLATLMFWPGLLCSLGVLGLEQAAAHSIAKSQADRDVIAATAIYLTVVLAAVTAALTFFLLPLLLGNERSVWWGVTQIYALSLIPIQALGTTLRAIDYGELRFSRYNAWRVAVSMLYPALLIGAWIIELVSVTTILWAAWFSVVVVTLGQAAIRANIFVVSPSWTYGLQQLSLSVRFHSTNLLFLLGSQIDRLLVVSLLGDAAVGFYSVALTWAGTSLHTIHSSFSIVMFPYLSAEACPERQRALLARGLRYACLLLAVGTAALIVVTAWLLPLLFGASFAPAVPAAFALAAAQFPMGLRQIMVQSLRGFGRARPGTIAEALSIGTFLACVIPLIKYSDLVGVGLALLVGNVVSLVYLVRYLKRHFDLGPADWWGLNVATLTEVTQLGAELLLSVLQAYKKN